MSDTGKDRATLALACVITLAGVVGLHKWLSLDLAWSAARRCKSAVTVLCCLVVAFGAWRSESRRLRKARLNSSAPSHTAAAVPDSSHDSAESCVPEVR